MDQKEQIEIAKRCMQDYAESHDGEYPELDELRTAFQQNTGIDLGKGGIAELGNLALTDLGIEDVIE